LPGLKTVSDFDRCGTVQEFHLIPVIFLVLICLNKLSIAHNAHARCSSFLYIITPPIAALCLSALVGVIEARSESAAADEEYWKLKRRRVPSKQLLLCFETS
jgi:hypothetical protein